MSIIFRKDIFNKKSKKNLLKDFLQKSNINIAEQRNIQIKIV